MMHVNKGRIERWVVPTSVC